MEPTFTFACYGGGSEVTTSVFPANAKVMEVEGIVKEVLYCVTRYHGVFDCVHSFKRLSNQVGY